jgi:hypothetical protein
MDSENAANFVKGMTTDKKVSCGRGASEMRGGAGRGGAGCERVAKRWARNQAGFEPRTLRDESQALRQLRYPTPATPAECV